MRVLNRFPGIAAPTNGSGAGQQSDAIHTNRIGTSTLIQHNLDTKVVEVNALVTCRSHTHVGIGGDELRNLSDHRAIFRDNIGSSGVPSTRLHMRRGGIRLLTTGERMAHQRLLLSLDSIIHTLVLSFQLKMQSVLIEFTTSRNMRITNPLVQVAGKVRKISTTAKIQQIPNQVLALKLVPRVHHVPGKDSNAARSVPLPISFRRLSGRRLESNLASKRKSFVRKLFTMGEKVGAFPTITISVEVHTNTRSGKRPKTRRQTGFQKRNNSLGQNRLIGSLDQGIVLRNSGLAFVMENTDVLTS